MILDELQRNLEEVFVLYIGEGGGGTIKQKTLILFSKCPFCVYKQVP